MTAQEHVEAAAKLIEETGYKRRLPELEALRAEIRARSEADPHG